MGGGGLVSTGVVDSWTSMEQQCETSDLAGDGVAPEIDMSRDHPVSSSTQLNQRQGQQE